MLFWKVAVPWPRITIPQIWLVVREEVMLSEWTRFRSIKLVSAGSVTSMPSTVPALPPVTMLLSE
jgi:hypothetical protein